MIEIVPGMAGECSSLRERYWSFPEDPMITIFSRHKNRAVGCVRIYKRHLFNQACWLDVAAIGGVYTRLDYRGRGVASDLLKYAHAYLDKRDFSASVLISPPRRLYESVGYDVCKRRVKKGQHLWARPIRRGVMLFESEDWDISPDMKF